MTMLRTLRLRAPHLLIAFVFTLISTFALLPTARAQSNSSLVNGTVTDTTGAVIPGATAVLFNPVSGFHRTSTSDSTGRFAFYNLPFDQYSLSVTAAGFSHAHLDVHLVSSVPFTTTVQLKPQVDETVTVTADSGGPLAEDSPTYHTDVDRTTIDRLPIESPSSSLSSIVTLTSPGVAADSNGLLHGLGDHNEDSFSIDGEPISDQQSKVFSNQVPAAAVQSLQVIDGAPPVEYGDKTSLVIAVTTRSGQGIMTPTGSLHYSFGTFGTSSLGVDYAQGGRNYGNFIAADGLQTSRFLDSPEFVVLHDKGNEENVFDRLDFNVGPRDAFHTNFQYTRSWFQTPNDYENYGLTDELGNSLGNTDQRSKIGTVDVSPTYTHTVSDDAVVNFGAFFRRDTYNYYPSSNPLSDYSIDQQQESIRQFRTLTNAGVRTDYSYLHGVNNVKFGGVYQQTFLRENDYIGVVDPTITPTCIDGNGNPIPCTSQGARYNPNVNPVLVPYDLTQGGSDYYFRGQTDVKELALYGEDTITANNFVINLGLRGDFYNGLTIQRQAEPRGGVSYNIARTGTVLRASYARTQETPFNENLVLSSKGCADTVLYNIFATLSDGSCSSQAATPFNPGFRNEFHLGFSQSVGRHFVGTLEYITKYTHNAYDFSVLGTTPITFPIEWHNSKIPGYAMSAALTDLKGLTIRVNASSVAARFFNPLVGGVGATPVSTNVSIANGFAPFRIDHDERFNQTTHLVYTMPFRKSMYYSFNWRYDSGLVAGAAPCYNVTGANTDCDPGNALTINGQPGLNLTYLSADQQFQAGLVCTDGGTTDKATPNKQLQQCTVAGLHTNLLRIPGANQEDADLNPNRIAPRNVFDMALGDDDVFHFGADKHYKISAVMTAINIANKYALYNFLSTFSGTHYLTPRTVTGEVAFHF
jgi:hypothetical protein